MFSPSSERMLPSGCYDLFSSMAPGWSSLKDAKNILRTIHQKYLMLSTSSIQQWSHLLPHRRKSPLTWKPWSIELIKDGPCHLDCWECRVELSSTPTALGVKTQVASTIGWWHSGFGINQKRTWSRFLSVPLFLGVGDLWLTCQGDAVDEGGHCSVSQQAEFRFGKSQSLEHWSISNLPSKPSAKCPKNSDIYKKVALPPPNVFLRFQSSHRFREWQVELFETPTTRPRPRPVGWTGKKRKGETEEVGESGWNSAFLLASFVFRMDTGGVDRWETVQHCWDMFWKIAKTKSWAIEVRLIASLVGCAAVSGILEKWYVGVTGPWFKEVGSVQCYSHMGF